MQQQQQQQQQQQILNALDLSKEMEGEGQPGTDTIETEKENDSIVVVENAESGALLPNFSLDNSQQGECLDKLEQAKKDKELENGKK